MNLADNLARQIGMRRRALHVPSGSHSLREYFRGNAIGLSNGGGGRPICEPTRYAAVDRLISSAFPSTVFRIIRSVIVKTLYGEIVRISARYRPPLEGGVIAPFVADRDAPAAVVMVARAVLGKATVAHSPPDAIEPRTIVTVFRAQFSGPVSAVTAARLRLSTPKSAPADRLFGATLANSAPHRGAMSRPRAIYHPPPSKGLPGHVFRRICHVVF